MIARDLLGKVCLAAAATQMGGPAGAQVSGSRPEVSLQCVSFGKQPMLDCIVLLKSNGGRPLDGARVTLGGLMPSMPMAHTIAPRNAVPTGKPGEYKATLELEMLGVWAVDVDISGPVRDKISRNLTVIGCKGDERCVAHPSKSGADRGEAGDPGTPPKK